MPLKLVNLFFPKLFLGTGNTLRKEKKFSYFRDSPDTLPEYYTCFILKEETTKPVEWVYRALESRMQKGGYGISLCG